MPIAPDDGGDVSVLEIELTERESNRRAVPTYENPLQALARDRLPALPLGSKFAEQRVLLFTDVRDPA